MVKSQFEHPNLRIYLSNWTNSFNVKELIDWARLGYTPSHYHEKEESSNEKHNKSGENKTLLHCIIFMYKFVLKNSFKKSTTECFKVDSL